MINLLGWYYYSSERLASENTIESYLKLIDDSSINHLKIFA